MSLPPVPPSRRDVREVAPSDGAVAPAAGGLRAIIARHPRIWLAAALGVAFLLLATAALFGGAAFGNSRADADGGAPAAAADVRPVPTAIADASRLRTCSVADLAADPALVTLSGAITNATTGELLFDRNATVGIGQGGVAKVVTAAAAISTLGPDTTFVTRVFEGSQPNTLVLVGGGDPTLSAVPSGQESVYAGAPKLASLVDQVEDSYTGDLEDVTSIVLDATLWSAADKWDPSWPRSAQTGGTLSEVTALQVDGDRADPQAQVSPRGTDPIMSAGRAFAAELGLDPDDVTFSLGSAVTTRPQLGQVASQPVSVLVTQMLQQDDGTLAEHLARLVSRSGGGGGTAASLNAVLTSAAAGFGVDIAGAVLPDGSGTSPATAVSPRFMADLMAKVLAGADSLNHVYNSLSVAGESGLLATRFAGTNAAAQGLVVGQPGSFGGGYSLAGVVTAADGTPLSFALYATGAGVKESSARAAMETLVTALMACGDNLSNN